MKKFKVRVRPGAIVAIPIPESGSCLAKVLFSSAVFKDVILIGILAAGREMEALRDDYKQVLSERQAYKGLIYTSATCVGDLWPIVGHSDVSDSETALSTRIVGTEVWEGDRLIRIATKQDYAELPEMIVCGCASAVLKIQTLIKKSSRR